MASRFGISTHLFHGERLARPHLDAVASHGFGAVEVYATRTHFDYHDPAAAQSLGDWLAATGVALHSVHAPTTVSYTGGRWGETLTIGASEERVRQQAVTETLACVALARILPYGQLVLHLGVPSADPGANSRAAVARSLETIAEAAADTGVGVAIELIPNALSTAAQLVQWLDGEMEIEGLGVCLDVGHAHLTGDAMDAIETCSGHIVTTHLHDNRGTRDEHLVPGLGTVDWDGVMMAFQKVGYDGRWMFELAPAEDWATVLSRAATARERLDRLVHMEF